jgi:hypothetical protein
MLQHEAKTDRFVSYMLGRTGLTRAHGNDLSPIILLANKTNTRS